MTKTRLVILGLAAILALGTFAIAQAPKPAAKAGEKAAEPDPRIDKLLKQNETILKNQDEIINRLDKLDKDLLQARRRSG